MRAAAVSPEPLQLATPRPMGMRDLDRVVEVEVRAYGFPWSRGNFLDSLAAGYWAELLEDAEGAVIGYWLAMPAVDEVHLLNLTVDPQHQGQGHARAMLDRLESRCRNAGLASLWLEVRSGNERARRLYEARGFTLRGLRRGYYPAAHSRREDAVVMGLDLPAG